MTILTLEQYKSAAKLCESLLNKNSTVRPSDAVVLGFPVDYEALARYVVLFSSSRVEYLCIYRQ